MLLTTTENQCILGDAACHTSKLAVSTRINDMDRIIDQYV